MRRIVIAIDGPAGSGKSTTARLVAKHLGYRYLDTGAMYRAVALKCAEAGLPLDSEAAVAQVAKTVGIDFAWKGESNRVFLDGMDVTDSIRTPAVTDASSKIAVFPAVRKVLVAKQRELGAGGGVVAEGRDTTTAVFPDAGLKIYMDADLTVRAKRRMIEFSTGGTDMELRDVENDMRERDRRDAGRKESPLSMASGALTVDTTAMSIEEQVEVVLKKAMEVMEDGA